MDGIDWAASAMVAARTRLDIAAHNLANLSTDAFRRIVARGALTAKGATVAGAPSQVHGALRHTGRDWDLAIVGDGAFRVREASGRVSETRDGAFVRERDGTLGDDRGGTLLGERGPLHAPDGARVDPDGTIRAGGREVGRIPLPRGSTVQSGFLETSGVDAIAEMIDVMTAQRSFESAQKVVSAIDETRQKSANEVARVR